MGYYVRYFLTEPRTLTLESLEELVPQIDPSLAVDADFLLLNDEEWAQIEISDTTRGYLRQDVASALRWAEEKEDVEELKAELKQAQAVIFLRLLSPAFARENFPKLHLLYFWLLRNWRGVWMDDRGYEFILSHGRGAWGGEDDTPPEDAAPPQTP